MASSDFGKLLAVYESELLDHVVPWWLQHAMDREYGGILYGLAQDGTVVVEDKSGWSQGRALYTFSALYNLVGKRHEWLAAADHICDFILPIGSDNNWQWPEALHRDGSVREGPGRIYADGFAIMGLTEYARATGSEEAIEAALATYRTVRERMTVPGPHLDVRFSAPTGVKCHGISMIFSIVFHELGMLLGDAEILQAGHDHAVQILDHFRKPERKLLLEYTAPDGAELQVPEGRHVNPGHGIESMWFVMHIFRDRRERRRIDQAIECLRWTMEACWDEECGGMFGALELDGSVPQPDVRKAMWPHGEALYALLLAYELCCESWCLEWYERLHEWTFAHFPDREHGEWREYVERDGSVPPEDAQRLPQIHTFFHLPRTLIRCMQVLQRLCDARPL